MEPKFPLHLLMYLALCQAISLRTVGKGLDPGGLAMSIYRQTWDGVWPDDQEDRAEAVACAESMARRLLDDSLADYSTPQLLQLLTDLDLGRIDSAHWLSAECRAYTADLACSKADR